LDSRADFDGFDDGGRSVDFVQGLTHVESNIVIVLVVPLLNGLGEFLENISSIDFGDNDSFEGFETLTEISGGFLENTSTVGDSGGEFRQSIDDFGQHIFEVLGLEIGDQSGDLVDQILGVAQTIHNGSRVDMVAEALVQTLDHSGGDLIIAGGGGEHSLQLRLVNRSLQEVIASASGIKTVGTVRAAIGATADTTFIRTTAPSGTGLAASIAGGAVIVTVTTLDVGKNGRQNSDADQSEQKERSHLRKIRRGKIRAVRMLNAEFVSRLS